MNTREIAKKVLFSKQVIPENCVEYYKLNKMAKHGYLQKKKQIMYKIPYKSLLWQRFLFTPTAKLFKKYGE